MKKSICHSGEATTGLAISFPHIRDHRRMDACFIHARNWSCRLGCRMWDYNGLRTFFAGTWTNDTRRVGKRVGRAAYDHMAETI